MKRLSEEGTMNYDFKYDILFLKAKNHDYQKSLEFDNFVVDLDSKNTVSGIEVFGASEYFGIEKEALRHIRKWKMEILVKHQRLEIKLILEMLVRNRVIQKNPIIAETLSEILPASHLVCAMGN